MNKRDLETSVSLILLLLLSGAVRAQVAELKGELRLYEWATQIGTVAIRELKDDKGRVVKAIYYTGGGDSEGRPYGNGPYREDLLREQSIQTNTYDDHDCRVKTKIYEPGMTLSRTAEVRCFTGTATPELTINRDMRGIRQSEVRHNAHGGTQTQLYFDDDGRKVVAINGETPTDVDIVHGWGEPLTGFACSIAANREKGRQEQVNVSVTIKNINHDADGVAMMAPVLMELKDSAGQVIQRKTRYAEPANEGQANGCPTCMNQGAPFAGRAQPQIGFALGEEYDPLAPGRYSMTVTYCVSGVPGRLTSNTILLEVEGRENR